MITRAIIKEKGSNDYLWKVHIPILDGKPDSEDEKTKFDAYYDNLTLIQTNSEDIKKDLLTVFLNKSSTQTTTETSLLYDKEYLREAHVCGIPNSIIHYQVGDVVIVGFEDNNMGKPIILGSLLTEELSDKTVTKVTVNTHTLTADENVTLPLSNTVFVRNDPTTNLLKEMSATDLETVVRFINALTNEGVEVNTIIAKLKLIDELTSKFNLLFPSQTNNE